MPKRTYTSTISVPVYAGWRCSKCQEINLTKGKIVCRYEDSTTSLLWSTQDKVKNEVSSFARYAWIGNALEIIADPISHPVEVRNKLKFPQNTCKRCGATPEWYKEGKYLGLAEFAGPFAFMSGMAIFMQKTNVIAWTVFIVFLGMIIYSYYTESQYKKSLDGLSKHYTPVLGSLNDELIWYASNMGISIPTPDEAIELVSANDLLLQKKFTPNTEVKTDTFTDKSGNTSIAIKPRQERYCKECGAMLFPGDRFCHKCGAKNLR